MALTPTPPATKAEQVDAIFDANSAYGAAFTELADQAGLTQAAFIALVKTRFGA